MKFRTGLDMDAVQAEVQKELAEMRAKGIPLVFERDGRIIQETLVNGVIEVVVLKEPNSSNF